MAVRKRLLHRFERAAQDVDAYFLAHDPETGAVYVLHEWLQPSHGGPVPGAARLELDDFLADAGPAQDRLRELVSTLVET